MRIYIATPVNGRPEPTLEEKRQKAFERVQELKSMPRRKGDEVVSSFDVCPVDKEISEAEAMGRCVGLLMTCDAILVDEDNHWENSKGCRVEFYVAQTYGLKVIQYHNMTPLEDEIIKSSTW